MFLKKALRPASSSKSGEAWLFAGLGNPGGEYSGNRHNIGFMLADALAADYGFPLFRSKFQGMLAEGTIADQRVILLKPTTYMNNSGQSVKAASQFYKINPERIVIMHDELDLPPGTVRVKKGGGNAGHNGLKSIQAHLGTPDFWRVRLGIGHPGDREKVHGYVLGNFSKADQQWLGPFLDSCAHRAGLLASGDMDGFAGQVAADTKDTAA